MVNIGNDRLSKLLDKANKANNIEKDIIRKIKDNHLQEGEESKSLLLNDIDKFIINKDSNKILKKELTTKFRKYSIQEYRKEVNINVIEKRT